MAGYRTRRGAGFAVDVAVKGPTLREAEALVAVAAGERCGGIYRLSFIGHRLQLSWAEPGISGRSRRFGNLPTIEPCGVYRCLERFNLTCIQPDPLATRTKVDRASCRYP